MNNFDIPSELKKLPQKPGVYLMKNADGVVIYVGKAVNLRSRVRQYFYDSTVADRSPANAKTAHLVGHITEFEYIVTDTELEALILEKNLIKKHSPKYNIMLKDDKNHFPYLKVSVNEDFPRLFIARQHTKDKDKYYGPYAGGAIKETIELAHKIWPLRRCDKKMKDKGTVHLSRHAETDEPSPCLSRPCLNHHIGLCKAPCAGLISAEDYARLIDEVIAFLDGDRKPVIAKLEEQMAQFAEELNFEKAAELRDYLAAVRRLDEKQKIETANGEDQDVIALGGVGEGEGDNAVAQVFFIRNGQLIGRETYMISVPNQESPEQTLAEFIKQFYSENTFIPKELILAHDIADRDVISQWLGALKGRSVSLIVPQRGEKLRLVRMAETNAKLAFEHSGEQMKRELARTAGALAELSSALELPELKRIEAYDVSNTQGYQAVASMVVFDNGLPKRSDYRKFKIKTVVGANDVAAIAEAVRRRFLRYKDERDGGGQGKFSSAPDILFIDGGRNQQQTAESVLRELEIDIPVCGMVKDDRHRTRGLYYGGREIVIPKSSEGFKLLTRIQDEVHRFAIEYHRKLREREVVRSILDDIPNIGAARRTALMKHFGSVEAIRRAEINELEEAPSMNRRAAEAVYNFFRK